MADPTPFNWEFFSNEISNISQRVNKLPTGAEVKNMINDGLKAHTGECPVYQRMLEKGVNDITGVHDVSKYRPERTSIPAAMAKAVPVRIRYLLFALGSAAAGAVSTWAAQ